MNRNTLFAVLTVAALGAVGVALLQPAEARRNITVDDTTATINSGTFNRTASGFTATVCGAADKLDGGPAPLERTCVDCSSVTWVGLATNCLAAFKAANTDP